MTGIVLDTSALLALMFREPGGDLVAAALTGPGPVLLATVNLAEVLTKLSSKGASTQDTLDDLRGLGVECIAFGMAEALAVGLVEPSLRRKGISLGDRACLMLARDRGLPVLTADRAWAALDIGVEVRLIR